MALLSSASINIDGNVLKHYNTFSLFQDLGEHHNLELYCNVQNIDIFCSENSFNINDFLGATITIAITPLLDLDFYKELRFKGIITGVKQKKGMHSGIGDIIVLQGKSPTILAEDGAHLTSFSEKSFTDIISEKFNAYDASKLAINTDNSKQNTPLLYTVQNNESCFEFAKNLSTRYGEWMYYSGTELVFGLQDEEELELSLGRDLKEFNTTLMPLPQNYNFISNDYLSNSVQEKDASSINGSSSQQVELMTKASDTIYPNASKTWFNTLEDKDVKSRLDSAVKTQKEAIQGNQVIINGTSDNPGIGLGKTVTIEKQGSFRVIKVSHNYNSNGEYENNFEAISSKSLAYPKTNISEYPQAQSQSAIVKDNNDPDGLARVKVQFPWQVVDGLMTPWIRVIAPHSGTDKGFHFIPEIGEEVLIGFEGSNAERPYLIGSLYNGEAKPSEWQTDKNDVKAIRTRSGHTIELNDKKGEEKINIYDNEGSIITFDTKKKSLFIQSAEDIEISAKNIKMMAEETIEIQAKKDIQTASEGNTEILAKGKTNIEAKQDISVNSSTKVTVEAKQDTTIKGMNVKADAKVAAELKGQQTKVQGQMTTIQGASGKVDVM